MWRERHLILSLVRRQFQLRYRQSFVGVFWAIIPSLAILAVAAVLFQRVIRVDTGDVPYTTFALSALTPWSLFASSLTFGVPSITQAAPLVGRLAFPRFVLPLSWIGVSLLDLGVAALVLLGFLMVTGAGLPLTALWFPLLLLVELLLVAGVVLLASAVNVFARDVRLAVPVLTQLWLLLTPVLYPLDSVPDGLRGWYLANPMTGIVQSFRRILVYGQAPLPAELLPAVAGSVLLFLIGSWYFRSIEDRFADVV